MFARRYFAGHYFAPRYWPSGAGVAPTPAPSAPESTKGGIPSKRGRRRERVYVQINDRTLWFANEANAVAFLRTQGAITEKHVAAEVERRSVVVADLPKVDTSPIVLPRITVRGSYEAEQYAKELDLRMRQMLAMLDVHYQALLDDDDEMMLLH